MKNKLWAGLSVAVLIVAAALPSLSQMPRASAAALIDVKSLQKLTLTGKVTLIHAAGLIACMDAKIPGSLCLACDDEKGVSALSSLTKDSKIVFYTGGAGVDPECELIKRLTAQGFTSVYTLSGGLAAWRQEGLPVVSEKRIPRVISQAVRSGNFSEWFRQAKNPLVIDIRSAKTYAAGHLDGAQNFPLTRLHIQYADIPLNRTLLIVDEDGTQSFLAASYLARKGFWDIQRLKGGMAGYQREAR